MKEVVTYLTFPGNCRDAMTFYQTVLGGKLDIMNAGPNHQPESERNLVMHARLGLEHGALMASDAFSHAGTTLVIGSNFSVSLDCSSEEEQQGYFDGLSEGGTVTMPLGDTFWGARFGMLKDKFGIQWMFNFDKGHPPA